MKAKSPVVNHMRLRFFTLLAFFLEWFRRRDTKEMTSPTSVRMTKGRNQSETRPHNHGKGLRLTAKKEKTDDRTAAFFSP
jgi:hypothetical protein